MYLALGQDEAVAEVAAEAEAEAPAFTTMEEFQAMPLAYPKFMVDNLWILIAAALVFLMHLGFATIESGLTRQKNTVNILFKNVFIISMGVLTYAFWGFNSMYPGDFNGWFALGTPIANGFEGADALANMTSNYADYTYWADFIFQAMFAATAATIVSGAVAERIKLGSFMIGATLLVAFVYPITGSWKWGGGWLDQDGFYDFAGSTLVHAFGGFAALAAVLLLGSRKGKYVNGQIKPILGHSMPLATIGAFLLFLGWFGFNGGSVLSADPGLVSLVFVTTAMAGCAGGLAAMAASWLFLKKPDLSMALNGLLAGLVGITAGADVISPMASIIVGAVAGVLVVLSVVALDKAKIDDPVGAISVHGTCGIWGTLAVGIFGGSDFSFATQLKGTLAISLFAFFASLIVFGLLKFTVGLRVSEQEEEEGLDVGEHGVASYPNFQPAVDL
ncbi:MAG: ammonium transporter [Pedosphaera sp.]|nr:ammonium transporter [Pedosphaera sp.]MAN30553.1 ammonium transporter [Pedosphaera sp.]